MKTAKEYITEMLKENTGEHFLDSGDAYGRNWETNQNKVFEDEPRVSYDIWGEEINITVSVYHYLCELLDVDELCEVVNI